MLTLHILLLVFITARSTLSVKFWHVTDFHYDPTYEGDGISCYGRSPDRPAYGNYQCDSPWSLVNNSVYAMKAIEPNPDFIIWTGDDTPHGMSLGTDAVLSIITNETKLLMEAFPSITVYSALGNHDYHPKHQMPPHNNTVYETLADLWKPWLQTSEAQSTFRNGGYYTLPIASGLRAAVINTVYYYQKNRVTSPDSYEDPAGQFEWLENLLANSSKINEKVYIIGHVPPGQFEKHMSQVWFYPRFNDRFNKLIVNHSQTIAAIFFAHHHTDTFRVFYSESGSPVASALLAPSVTPWKTTLPDVIGSASNNPGIRLFSYTRPDQLDYTQYYTDIDNVAENGSPSWIKEYTASQAYDIPYVSASSLDSLIKKMDVANSTYFDKYYKHNSVSIKGDDACTGTCKTVQICAIKNVDFDAYDVCLASRLPTSDASVAGNQGYKLILSFVTFFLLEFL